MWTRELLKQNAKIAFKRNYWVCVIVCVIAMLLGGITSGEGLNLSSNNNNSTNLIGNNNIFSDDDYDDGYGGQFDSYYDDDLLEEKDLGAYIEDALAMFWGNIPSYVFLVFGAVVLIAIVLGLAMGILVSNVVAVGCCRFFYGFKNGRYLSNVLVMFLKKLYIFLWSLLLVIPGIVKSYSFYLVDYILAENSDLNKSRVFEMSKTMMKGHKMEAFVLELSFIGWHLLSTLTFGLLNVFYVNPYLQATKAEFYSAIKAEALQNGIVSYSELPGVSYTSEGAEVVM